MVLTGAGDPDLASSLFENSTTVLAPVLATHASPLASKAMPSGALRPFSELADMVTVGFGAVLASWLWLNRTSELPAELTSQRLPEESKLNPDRVSSPTELRGMEMVNRGEGAGLARSDFVYS